MKQLLLSFSVAISFFLAFPEYEHMASYSGNAFGNVNYLYHNLGLGGSLNGWYISDTFTAGSNTMQPTNMIYNITAP